MVCSECSTGAAGLIQAAETTAIASPVLAIASTSGRSWEAAIGRVPVCRQRAAGKMEVIDAG